MINRSNSLNFQIKEKSENILKKIHQIQKIHIKKQESSDIKLPKLKYFMQQTELSSLNNIETTNSSANVKKVKNIIGNRIFVPVLRHSSKKIEIKPALKRGSLLPLKLKIKKFFPLDLKSSASVESLITKNIPSTSVFHKKLMEENRLSCGRRLNEDYRKFKNNENDKEEINEMINERRGTKKVKTGIFGPANNIVSVIRSRMERLRLDNEYRKVEEELKEIIKDEILDAQVKLKVKPIDLFKKKDDQDPLYIRKLDKYRYLERMNLIREINQNSATPLIVKDGNMMLRLINDAFGNFKAKKF